MGLPRTFYPHKSNHRNLLHSCYCYWNVLHMYNTHTTLLYTHLVIILNSHINSSNSKHKELAQPCVTLSQYSHKVSAPIDECVLHKCTVSFRVWCSLAPLSLMHAYAHSQGEISFDFPCFSMFPIVLTRRLVAIALRRRRRLLLPGQWYKTWFYRMILYLHTCIYSLAKYKTYMVLHTL